MPFIFDVKKKIISGTIGVVVLGAVAIAIVMNANKTDVVDLSLEQSSEVEMSNISSADISNVGSVVDASLTEINNAANSDIAQIQSTVDIVESVKTEKIFSDSSQQTILMTDWEDKKIIFTYDVYGIEYAGDFSITRCKVDTDNHMVTIAYGGDFSGNYDADHIKDKGLALKDYNGNIIDYSPAGEESYSIKFSYANLSDIENIYFCIYDQQIKISCYIATLV